MNPTEVFINAGDFYFHRPDVHRPAIALAKQTSPLLLRTLLGSCVSIVLWHPGHRFGGMCHSVLPVRGARAAELDANHCEGAVQLFQREVQRTSTSPAHYRAYILGGSRMSLGLRQVDRVSVGERNVESCRTLLKQAGFVIAGEHLGQTGPRRILFNVDSGSIDVTHNHRTVTLAPGS